MAESMFNSPNRSTAKGGVGGADDLFGDNRLTATAADLYRYS